MREVERKMERMLEGRADGEENGGKGDRSENFGGGDGEEGEEWRR